MTMRYDYIESLAHNQLRSIRQFAITCGLNAQIFYMLKYRTKKLSSNALEKISKETGINIHTLKQKNEELPEWALKEH